MNEYSIRLDVPARRGSTHVIVVVEDAQGNQIFWDWANLNEEKTRTKVSARIAQKTGDDPAEIERRLLHALATLPPPANRGSGPPAGSQLADFPYEATRGGLIRNKETAEGIVVVPLTTFTAKITGQVVEDDGAETRRLFDIEATLWGRKLSFQVPAGQFTGMTWPIDHLGAGAALYAGLSVKDHARTAIQFLSGNPPERRVYAHLGWRKIGGIWCYLHAGGAIGPVGPVPDVEVSLPSDLQRYTLPDPPFGEDLVLAIQSSLRLLEVAEDQVAFATYCSIWRAPLGECDSSQHLFGRTGAGKSELAALAQQHYGPGLDSRHLPGNWTSTDNALEMLAFIAKDALVVIDDFCPAGSLSDAQALQRKAERLFRAQGNSSGRQRLRSDGTPRPVKPPRGMILSTGEDVPKGQSLRARMLISEVPKDGPGALDWGALTLCQKDAGDGLYAQAMAGFVRWLASRYKEIQTGLQTEISTLRTQAHEDGQHRRTPDIVANLAVGFRYFLDYAQEAGAVTETQSEELWRRCWDALGEAAAAQGEHQAESEPVGRFLELLSAALSSGRAHLAGPDGLTPVDAAAWGWRESPAGTGIYARVDFQPQGERIGWFAEGEIYLLSDAAYAVAQKLARDGGDNLSITLPTLKRRLKEQGLLASTEVTGGKVRLEVRRSLDGDRYRVLHLKPHSLSTEVGQVGRVRHDGTFTEDADTDSGDIGAGIGAHPEVAGPEVRQQSAPETPSTVSGRAKFGPLGPLGPLNEVEVVEEFIDEVLD